MRPIANGARKTVQQSDDAGTVVRKSMRAECGSPRGTLSVQMQDSLYSEGFKFTKMEDNRMKKRFAAHPAHQRASYPPASVPVRHVRLAAPDSESVLGRFLVDVINDEHRKWALLHDQLESELLLHRFG